MAHEKLKFAYDNFAQKRGGDIAANSTNDAYIQKHVRSAGISMFKRIGVFKVSDHNLLKAKTYLFYSAIFAEYVLHHFENSLWPGLDVKPYVCALLSDNAVLIDRYANLDLTEQNWPENTGPSPFNDAIQGLLNDDKIKIERAITSYQDRIQTGKQLLWSRSHLLAIESIVACDKAGLEKAIMGYEHKTVKKAMINADICEEVLSFWNLLWAKIGWLKGICPEVDCERVPRDLLEIVPLEEYTIPYWFLRDFYRDQGVNWRYDPVYPELQDWDNDPENPDKNKGGFFKKIFS